MKTVRSFLSSWGKPRALKAADEAAAGEPVIVYGAGVAGRQLVRALSAAPETHVAAIVDDDSAKHGLRMETARIYPPSDLATLRESTGARTVLVAMPSLPKKRLGEILEVVRAAGYEAQTVPSLGEILGGRASLNAVKTVRPEDLLPRVDMRKILSLTEKRFTRDAILVTGAGGSIGSELCRTLMTLEPRKLVLLDSSEYALYAIERELRETSAAEKKTGTEIIPVLGSVLDRSLVRRVLAAQGIDRVYHAAAYKHVPLVEGNALVGLRNNVFGTEVIAAAALEAGVRRFILVSTDKAVRPTNVMGASKRLSEMVVQACDARSNRTTFSMVRFGNVLGSSGSVVPLFQDQIARGGPVTLTDPEVTRYFMTIPEAARLVIQAGELATGGEVYVLDMGEPVRILDLARRMIELNGGRPVLPGEDEPETGRGVRIDFVGLRPGEKLYEELLIGDDTQPSGHDKIMRAIEAQPGEEALRAILDQLDAAIEAGDVEAAVAVVAGAVEGFAPSQRSADPGAAPSAAGSTEGATAKATNDE